MFMEPNSFDRSTKAIVDLNLCLGIATVEAC